MRTTGGAIVAIIVSLLGPLFVLTGCGGGSVNTGGKTVNQGCVNPGVGNQSITVTFIGGIPQAVATQTGSCPFATATPGNQVTFSVPPGNPRYAIAYVCSVANPPFNTSNAEVVIEATTQDLTSFTTSCLGSPNLGTATGSVATSIGATAAILVVGNQGYGGTVSSQSGSFAFSMPIGNNDVGVIAAAPHFDEVLAIKILRSQTIPGVLNGGSVVSLSSADAPTSQNLTTTNVPSGFFNPPVASVRFHTATGTVLGLPRSGITLNPKPYAGVPPALTLPTDFYEYESFSSDAATQNQTVRITTTTTNGGGAFTQALPAPWSWNGPAPAKFPTFNFVYSGFNTLPAVSDQASISWGTPGVSDQITMVATANFQSGATTITIPDLTSLPGFLAPAPTSTTINWVADIFGGTEQEFTFSANLPANSSIQSVENKGTFVQP
jgi:hypothetical protein